LAVSPQRRSPVCQPEAIAELRTLLRLVGKPVSVVMDRMGVELAREEYVDAARATAKRAAAKLEPRR